MEFPRKISLLSFCILIYLLPSLGFSSPRQARVAILNVTFKAKSKLNPEVLRTLLQTKTAQFLGKDYNVLSKENIMVLLPPEVKLEDCDGECEVETGRLLSADYIITAELSPFGSSELLVLKLFSTRLGNILSSTSTRLKVLDEDVLTQHLDSLVKQLTLPLTDPYVKRESMRGTAKIVMWGSIAASMVGGALVTYSNTIAKTEAIERYRDLNITEGRSLDTRNGTLNVTGIALLSFGLGVGLYSAWLYKDIPSDNEIQLRITPLNSSLKISF